MPVFLTSYDTTASLINNTSDLERKLRELLIKGNLDNQSLGVSDTDYKLRFLLSLDVNEEDIQKYPHPILIQGPRKDNYLITDLRPYIRSDATYANLRDHLRNKTLFDMQIGRAVMNSLWLNPDQRSSMMVKFRLAAKLYSEVLSQLINRAYVLDFRQLINLKIALMYFYYSLFFEEGIDADKKPSVIFHIIQNTQYTGELVNEVVGRMRHYSNIQEFSDDVAEICDSARLSKFNFAVLLNLISHAWYGNESKEITAVSLETPFNWISLCYAILSDKGYKNSHIYKVAEKTVKSKEIEEYMLNYKGTIGTRMALEAVSLRTDVNELDTLLESL